jgi:multimeric flavodoxin WrbA
MTKVLAINGSPRRDGNTQIMIGECARSLRRESVDVEIVSLRDYAVKPCNGCEVCFNKPWKCPIKDDTVKLLRKMVDADGILIGSPVYSADVTAQLKALLDRCVMIYSTQELKNKVGGAIVVGGGDHGGQELALIQMISFFSFHGLIPAGPSGSLFGALATANDRG